MKIMETQEKQGKFDLEERTYRFADDVRALLKQLPPSTAAADDRNQLSRSSGSVAANYLEANEAISTKDFGLRIKIVRKEARESHLWLRLIRNQLDPSFYPTLDRLIDEAHQLVKIFNSIAYKFRDFSK